MYFLLDRTSVFANSILNLSSNKKNFNSTKSKHKLERKLNDFFQSRNLQVSKVTILDDVLKHNDKVRCYLELKVNHQLFGEPDLSAFNEAIKADQDLVLSSRFTKSYCK